MAKEMKGKGKKPTTARSAKGAPRAKASAGSKGKALRSVALPPSHPMTAEQDRLEDEDGPFDDGVH